MLRLNNDKKLLLMSIGFFILIFIMIIFLDRIDNGGMVTTETYTDYATVVSKTFIPSNKINRYSIRIRYENTKYDLSVRDEVYNAVLPGDLVEVCIVDYITYDTNELFKRNVEFYKLKEKE